MPKNNSLVCLAWQSTLPNYFFFLVSLAGITNAVWNRCGYNKHICLSLKVSVASISLSNKKL